MKFKLFLYHSHEWLFVFPATMFHELCHWIVAMFYYCIGLVTSVPKIKITEWHQICSVDDYMSTKSMSACVTYSTRLPKGLDNFVNATCAMAPMVGVIILMLSCPWYINILIFSKITTFWPSIGDFDTFNKCIGRKKEVSPEVIEDALKAGLDCP